MNAQSKVSIVGLEPGEEIAYNTFLLGIEDSLLYYSLKYKKFLESLLGCKSSYWLAKEEGRIAGILPLMESEGPWGRVLNGLPYYGSNGGMLATDQKALAALCAKYNELTSHADIACATLIEHPFHPLPEHQIKHDFVDERLSQFS